MQQSQTHLPLVLLGWLVADCSLVLLLTVSAAQPDCNVRAAAHGVLRSTLCCVADAGSKIRRCAEESCQSSADPQAGVDDQLQLTETAQTRGPTRS